MQVWQQVQVQPFYLGFSLSPPEGGRNTGDDSVSRPARGAVKNTRGAVPENVVVAVQQALVGCVQEPASGLEVLGVKHPTGENSSGQTYSCTLICRQWHQSQLRKVVSEPLVVSDR